MPVRPGSDGMAAALRRLKQAHQCAELAGVDASQFAAMKDDLLAAGATPGDLLWLVEKRYAQHLLDVTPRGQARRQFRVATTARLRGNSCFALTYAGNLYADHHSPADPIAVRDCGPAEVNSATLGSRLAPKVTRSAAGPAECADAVVTEENARDAMVVPPVGDEIPNQPLPSWDAVEGALYFRGQLLRRRGRKLGGLEEFLLSAFTDAKWRHTILNPFTDDPSAARQQAKDVVRRLNSSLLHRTLVFGAKGGGALVYWKPRIDG